MRHPVLEHGLTRRQLAVLKGIAENWTMEQIAAELRLSPKSVEYHRAQVIRLLGRNGTAYLTQFALSRGIARWIV